jgi:hypothetical protein
VSTVELGVTASALASRLESWPRRVVRLEELFALLVEAEPALEHAPERRERMGAVIGELVAAEVVRLPAARSYDHSAEPALPRFVRLDRPAQPPRRRSGADYAWRPELAWAADLSLDEQLMSELRAVNTFLRDGGAARPVVPLRERSLQLFGDEKRLEALRGGQLFAPGRLSLAQLRCEAVHPPFVYQRVGEGPDALVVENHHTYVSFERALAAGGEIGSLIYGAGAHFKASVSYLTAFAERPRRVLYFGDLDATGLEIPQRASEVASAAGLPPIDPAAPLYRLLLELGTPAPAADPISLARARKLVGWLPADLRPAGLELLRLKKRIAQEWVGTEALQADASLMPLSSAASSRQARQAPAAI